MMPRRLQLRRARGWRLPLGAIKVDRSTPWGNPYVVGQNGTAAECVRLYEALMAGLIPLLSQPRYESAMASRQQVVDYRGDLAGRDLACWCRLCPEHKDGKPLGVECANCAPCHADVLLRIANPGDP